MGKQLNLENHTSPAKKQARRFWESSACRKLLLLNTIPKHASAKRKTTDKLYHLRLSIACLKVITSAYSKSVPVARPRARREILIFLDFERGSKIFSIKLAVNSASLVGERAIIISRGKTSDVFEDLISPSPPPS